ncbi:MAG: AAA family ATPase [Muribaculaceae bacterium]|nr:AAA family ATPase [Muribaculaceae bacterium]
MTMYRKEKYGIGQQDFRVLREDGCVYVDKTSYIERLLGGGSKYYFLARPRRFGKSLFLSVLRYFFEGRRELFEGLYIDRVPREWKEYPVLSLDLNANRYAEPDKLDGVLDYLFHQWEEKYGLEVRNGDPGVRFKAIIEGAHSRTGLPVVILVDEYDKPLVGNLNNPENFEHYRSRLASLYSNFKSSAEHIKMVFLTGVSRFSKLSVFSDLNNLNDITFSDEYADICGITEGELLSNFGRGIRELGEVLGETYEETVKSLKANYDGYRFAAMGSDIYNPWSVLNCLEQRRISNFWNETGMPTIIAESLKRMDEDLENLLDTYCSEDDLKGLDLLNPSPTALMYQTGYLTIKEYNQKFNRYRLGVPNNEVKEGLFNILLPYYVTIRLLRAPHHRRVDSEIIQFFPLQR